MLDFSRLKQFFHECFRLEDRHRPDRIVPFDTNSAQEDLLHLCAKVQEQRQLVWIIAIKPRRIGLTRVMSGIGTAMTFHYPGMKARVMAHLGSTLDEIMASIALMASGLPVPVKTDLRSNQPKIEIGRGARRSILTGSKALATGEGRGGAAQFMQLDEAAHYPMLSPFTAMLPLVPRSLHSFCGIVSTPSPDRRGIAFKEMWDQARWVHETRRDALFVRYFCPWMKDPYAFADPKIAKAPYDSDERALMASGIGKAQIAWRRQEIRGRYRGRKEFFEMENPSDPLSCFTQVDLPAFSLEEREWAKRSVVMPLVPPGAVGVGSFVGSDNRDQFPIRVRLEEQGPWRIYEEPQKGCEYYIGVDAARGYDALVGGDDRKVTDFAAIVVINGTTSAVAAVFEARFPPDRVAMQVSLAGKFYRTMEISEWNYALLNIATTDGYGNEIQRRLKEDWGYPIHRFLRWRGKDDRIHGRPGTSIGWVDTAATNDMRLNAFRIALANHQFFARDFRLVEQIMQASMRGTDAEVYRGHDDVLDAAEYAWIARDLERPRENRKVDDTITARHAAVIRLANDPRAVFNALWADLQKMSKPGRADALEQMVSHINDARVIR